MADRNDCVFARSCSRSSGDDSMMFSTSMEVAATSVAVLNLIESSPELREKLNSNTRQFREGMKKNGFAIPDSDHPIVPIMLGDAALATRMASMLLDEGIYVIGFSYPVVPKGKARIRTQMSAAHTPEQIDRCVAAFIKVGKALGAV